MPCEMVSLEFDANFATKLKERVIHKGLKKGKLLGIPGVP